MTFDDFSLDPRVKRAVKAHGFEEPTQIQQEVIPAALEGRDVIAVAQTGTGKTLAYGLPALSRLAAVSRRRHMMLVLVPTRELAQQCHDMLHGLARAVQLRSLPVYGGMGIRQQISKLRKGREIIVATPGRLLDHIERNNISFRDLQILVMDEADRMLDMGFLPDIVSILKKLPQERQTIMCSATWPDEVSRLADRFLHEPELISAGEIAKPVETVRQTLYPVYAEDKQRLLFELLDDQHIESAVIFLRTKQRTIQLTRALKRKGYKATEIHGDRSQKQREIALDGFKRGRYRLLVATDVAARGLDIEGITHVINYDIPMTPEDYIHRIGRTARAQREGDAITFVTPQEHEPLANIERTIQRNIPRTEWERAAPVLSTWKPPGAERAQRLRRRGIAKKTQRRLL